MLWNKSNCQKKSYRLVLIYVTIYPYIYVTIYPYIYVTIYPYTVPRLRVYFFIYLRISIYIPYLFFSIFSSFLLVSTSTPPCNSSSPIFPCCVFFSLSQSRTNRLWFLIWWVRQPVWQCWRTIYFCPFREPRPDYLSRLSTWRAGLSHTDMVLIINSRLFLANHTV